MASTILGPNIPLLFMGEEYGETAPFLYFVSHTDAGLIEAVRKGRRAEFEDFAWQGEAPDPQDEATFLRTKIDPALAGSGEHAALLETYRGLIALRASIAAFEDPSFERQEVTRPADMVLSLRRWHGEAQAVGFFNLADTTSTVRAALPPGAWRRRFDSASEALGGPGSIAAEVLTDTASTIELPARSAVLYERA
jgi:maltooligosyltrehalose trehalohydrolase